MLTPQIRILKIIFGNHHDAIFIFTKSGVHILSKYFVFFFVNVLISKTNRMSLYCEGSFNCK